MEINKDKVLEILNDEIIQAGSQKACAKQWKISPSYLNDILKGSRGLTDTVLNKIEHVTLTIYVPTERAKVVIRAIENLLEADTKLQRLKKSSGAEASTASRKRAVSTAA